MLASLHIENIAVIAKADIEFGSGFTVLTGETGAGKSIVIDSLGAVMGNRVSRDLVRAGSSSAFVSALFTDVNEPARRVAADLGFDTEEDSLLIQRTIGEDGRSACKLNGRPATAAILQAVTRGLINIHGQHDNGMLLSQEFHYQYVDALAENGELLQSYRSAYIDLCKLQAELRSTSMDESQKAQRLDFLNYQIEELEAAQLRPGETEELSHLRAVYQNAKKITAALYIAHAFLRGDEESEGAADLTERAADAVEEIGRYLPALMPAAERLRGIAIDLEEIVSDLQHEEETVVFDPEDLEQIERRLDYLYRLSTKYGKTVEEMLAYLEKARRERDDIRLSDEKAAALSADIAAMERTVKERGGNLSRSRGAAAQKFATEVGQELAFLDMPKVRFQADIKSTEPGPNGLDRVEFLISANPGEPPKPLAKIASGGELSRIMLAIKSVLARKDATATLIFDEIDTGISGRAAQKVGIKLKSVAVGRQVICVTHLAQIAALGDFHLLIEKSFSDKGAFTTVTPLTLAGRQREIARIISGEKITETTLKSAAEMLKQAH